MRLGRCATDVPRAAPRPRLSVTLPQGRCCCKQHVASLAGSWYLVSPLGVWVPAGYLVVVHEAVHAPECLKARRWLRVWFVSLGSAASHPIAARNVSRSYSPRWHRPPLATPRWQVLSTTRVRVPSSGCRSPTRRAARSCPGALCQSTSCHLRSMAWQIQSCGCRPTSFHPGARSCMSQSARIGWQTCPASWT